MLNPTLLSQQLKQLLGTSPQLEDFNIIVIVSEGYLVAIFKLFDKSNVVVNYKRFVMDTCYSNEKTIFGQSIRLLYKLDTDHQLTSWLLQKDIQRIIVANTPDPTRLNASNHKVFATDDIEENFKGLRLARNLHPGALNIAIETLINENSY